MASRFITSTETYFHSDKTFKNRQDFQWQINLLYKNNLHDAKFVKSDWCATAPLLTNTKQNYEICYKHNCKLWLGTEQNCFGWKTDEIAKFGTLDGKTEFTILDGIWTKNGQMANWLSEKKLSFFHIHDFTLMFLHLVWNNGCLELLGCELLGHHWSKWSRYDIEKSIRRVLRCDTGTTSGVAWCGVG